MTAKAVLSSRTTAMPRTSRAEPPGVPARMRLMAEPAVTRPMSSPMAATTNRYPRPRPGSQTGPRMKDSMKRCRGDSADTGWMTAAAAVSAGTVTAASWLRSRSGGGPWTTITSSVEGVTTPSLPLDAPQQRAAPDNADGLAIAYEDRQIALCRQVDQFIEKGGRPADWPTLLGCQHGVFRRQRLHDVGGGKDGEPGNALN